MIWLRKSERTIGLYRNNWANIHAQVLAFASKWSDVVSFTKQLTEVREACKIGIFHFFSAIFVQNWPDFGMEC